MERLLRSLVYFFGLLILKEGRFPCDPHASNLLVQRSASTCIPRLILIDFGQVSRIDAQTRTALARIIVALAARDTVAVTQVAKIAALLTVPC